MKQTVLFIHGAGGYHEDQALAESLQRHLGEDFQVLAPEMPDADEPNYAKWRDEIAQQIKPLENPVLVGHSLGGSVLLKYLTEITPAPSIAGLFLLAAPYWGAPDWDAKEFELAPDFAAKLPPNLPIFLSHSRDDDVVPFDHLGRYAAQLPQAHVHRLRVRGHQLGNDLSEVAQDIKTIKELTCQN